MAAEQKVVVPDIGGASSVDVIELLVKPGDKIDQETPLITLESDKATMEIPSPFAGEVASLSVKVGDKVSEGDLILILKSDATEAPKTIAQEEPKEEKQSAIEKKEEKPTPVIEKLIEIAPIPVAEHESSDDIYAGPAVRRMARALGVHLDDVAGSGPKARITKEDIEQYIKKKMTEKSVGGSSISLPPARVIDFSKFGEIETKPLNKIKRLTGIGVHQSWITIPHVTQFDTADITELEAFRQAQTAQAKEAGYKLTLLAFVCKVVTKALEVFPQFNSSLDASGENLIYKHYFNVGIAVETPNGLVVPVIKEVDRLSVSDVAKEMARLSTKAREKGLAPADMSGGCFTISSLGGIGGHAFTPIVNSPEVAILGLSRSSMQPVYENGQFVPRLILPLSLSYDHRVIDGAEAARFTRYISESLSDIRRIIL